MSYQIMYRLWHPMNVIISLGPPVGHAQAVAYAVAVWRRLHNYNNNNYYNNNNNTATDNDHTGTTTTNNTNYNSKVRTSKVLLRGKKATKKSTANMRGRRHRKPDIH